jgi:hypothetical protein
MDPALYNLSLFILGSVMICGGVTLISIGIINNNALTNKDGMVYMMSEPFCSD